MVDTAAPRPRQDDTLAAPVSAPSSMVMPGFRWPRGWVRPLLWAALVAVAAGYLLIGTIRIGAGNWTGRRMGADAIWRGYLAFIAELGAPPAILIAITAAAALTLVCSGWALWLALALRDRGEAPVDDEA